jgi:Lar family restriction alleviation protein
MGEGVEKLKPCPFCGEAEELYPAHYGMGGGKPYAIDCLGCGFDFVPREHIDVITAWNRRAALASSTPESSEQAGPALNADFAEELRERLLSLADDADLKRRHTHLNGEIRTFASIVRIAANVLGRPLSAPESAVYPDWRPIVTAPYSRAEALFYGSFPERDPEVRIGSTAGWDTFVATHWMPLPPAPAEARSDKPEGEG